jgi:hypothetical protein
MFFRVFSFLILMFFFTSCDKLPFSKNKEKQVLDTIVDYTAVDLSPSFPVCGSIIDKTEKSNCFRNTIHKKIGEELQKHSLTSQDSIDETVYVDLLINSEGFINFLKLESSENIKKQLPTLDSIVQLSVDNLPKIFPAIKKRFPVATKYRLPIRIVLTE